MKMITRGSDELLERMKQLHPLMIDLSLGRIERLLLQLGSPEARLPPVVHIAGTNGKGSVTAFLKAMCEAAGLRTGAYTSPHLVNFHERISVPAAAGAVEGRQARSLPISEARLVDVLTRVLEVNGNDPITFFEITTAAAFLAFAESDCDVVLLEVGLGGRFDTTNVVASPALTIITPVSMDHADKLGDTIEKIAREKAGILKPGVPAVIAAQSDEARFAIHDEAEKLNAPLSLWGQHFDAFKQNGRLVYQSESRLLDLPLPGLNGGYQIMNAGVAIAAALALRDCVPALRERLSDGAIETGLTEVRWPGRLQRLAIGQGGTDGIKAGNAKGKSGGDRAGNASGDAKGNSGGDARRDAGGDDGQPGAGRAWRDDLRPLTWHLSEQSELWLDGGHNEAAGRALAQAMADLEDQAPKPLILVVGMMAQKDASAFLRPFAGLARLVIAIPVGSTDSNWTGDAGSHGADALARIASDLDIAATTAAGPEEALAMAAEVSPEPHRILICGSLYLAGQVLAGGCSSGGASGELFGEGG